MGYDDHVTDADRLDRAAELFHQLDSLTTDTPENATAWDRVLARLWDFGMALIAALILSAINFCLEIAFWGGREYNELPTRTETAFAAAFVISWLVLVAWNETFGFGGTRQTLGIRAMGLQVVLNETGARPGAMLMFGRWATVVATMVALNASWVVVSTRIPPVLALLGVVGLVALSWRLVLGRDGRALHDRIWGTRLVRPR